MLSTAHGYHQRRRRPGSQRPVRQSLRGTDGIRLSKWPPATGFAGGHSLLFLFRFMKIFHCDQCGHLVYFENTSCLNCGTQLAYLPERSEIASLLPSADGFWQSSDGISYRQCENYASQDVCNWAVEGSDPQPYCLSCRLTTVLPYLSADGNKQAWAKLEAAKRRLIYSLVGLNLPIVPRTEDPAEGLEFQFLEDQPGAPVLTGHDEGVIVINIAEADDSEREKRRSQLHEPYRTILGHFRHEVGHYYWDRLIKDTEYLKPCRQLFGNEEADYGEALKVHYANGAPADWQDRFISTYASSHPWEDWAETWAHYLHMTDTLETAAACGVSLMPARKDEPTLEQISDESFESMIAGWVPLTHMLNNLNRGLGLSDGYPFVLSEPVLQKLKFIHEVVSAKKQVP